MRKFTKRVEAGAEAGAEMPCVTLPFDSRRKSRQVIKLKNGEEIGLLLPPGTLLRDGEIVESEDGSRLRIDAAKEELMLVTVAHPLQLLRAAYHLGNRHTPIEIRPDRILFQADPVLREMLVGLGLTVATISEKFAPEAGAYGGGHKHGHDATFAEDQALAQRTFHEHEPK
jgi:urease accessory protein